MAIAIFLFLLPLGTSISLLIMSSILNKSNNFGDSKCTLYDFGPHRISGLVKQNRVGRSTPVDGIQNPVILEQIRAYDEDHGLKKHNWRFSTIPKLHRYILSPA